MGCWRTGGMPQTAEMPVDRGDAGEQVGCGQTGEMLVDRWDAGRQGGRQRTGEMLVDRGDAGRQVGCWQTEMLGDSCSADGQVGEPSHHPPRAGG